MRHNITTYIKFSFWVGIAFLMLSPMGAAFAQTASDISDNIVDSVNKLPGFITMLSYLLALLFGVTAIIKTKDHVENPNQTPLREPVIRFLTGGFLLALPIFYEAIGGMVAGASVDTLDMDDLDSYGGIIATDFGAAGALTDDLNGIFQAIYDSVDTVPGFFTGFAYLAGIVLGFWAILKFKDHVENPGNTPLREGITKLLAAAFLFALPFFFTVLQETISGGGTGFDTGTNLLTPSEDILTAGPAPGSDFNAVLGYITGSVSGLPILFSLLAYFLGMILGISAIFKIKDHIENPSNTPLRSGIINLLIGGALFALPVIYSVLYITVSGGDAGGLVGTVTDVSDELSTDIGICSGLTDTGKLDQVICSLTLGTSGLPAFFTVISYMIGIVLGFWGLIKLKDHVDNPGNVQIWDALVRFVAAGAFFGLPMLLLAFANTIGLGIDEYTTGAFSGTVSAGGLDSMMVGFVDNLYEPARILFRFFAYVGGVIFIMIGISRLLKSAQDGPRGPGGIGTLMTLLTGGALLALNPMIGSFSATLFGDNNITTNAILAADIQAGLGASADHVHAVISAVLKFLIVIGIISFLRGIFIFRSVAEGNGQASMMAGVTHLIGGAIAINLGPFLNIIQKTLGISTYGVTFS